MLERGDGATQTFEVTRGCCLHRHDERCADARAESFGHQVVTGAQWRARRLRTVVGESLVELECRPRERGDDDEGDDQRNERLALQQSRIAGPPTRVWIKGGQLARPRHADRERFGTK